MGKYFPENGVLGKVFETSAKRLELLKIKELKSFKRQQE